MPIVEIQAADCDSCTDFAWFVFRCLLHTGAIFFDDYSEVNVPERGSVSFVNNHAGSDGGKHCHPCPG